KSMGARYARFNLGVALVKAGESDKGEAVLDALGKDRAPDNEYRSLRDQANVAIGYSALASQRPQLARTVLERVRLESFHANKALLGFGWAADDLKDTKGALVPWIELADRDMNDAAALEARIAVPYAYTKLGAYAQAFDRYQVAIASFEIEHKALDESIAAIRAGKLVDALIVHNPGEEMGWFWSMQDVPEMPHAGHLVPVLAQHEFQEAFKNYRDLLFLGRNLAEWREKLAVFDEMLATKKKAYAERLPVVLQRAGALGLERVRKQREALAEQIQKGMDDADGFAFADAKELALLARVEAVRREIAKGGDEADLAPARERLRLASGALTWQLGAAQTDRIWQAKKDLQAIDTQIAEAERRYAALAEAQRDEPARFDAFAARIAALRPRLDVMIPRVAQLTQEQQEAVQGIAVAELQRQQERLGVYATQARFAVAQLVDRAYVRQETDHAAARP
ncbi:MAG TPA: hypothetical protein VMU47_04550, partial [Caldimonas sp.]|nr:hypothetical protein [Caldimonas sp.]